METTYNSNAKVNEKCKFTNKFTKTFVALLLIGICVFSLEYLVSSRSNAAQVIPKYFHEIVMKTSKALKLRHDNSPSVVFTTPTSIATTNVSKIPIQKPHYMTMSGLGRLGNQMFEFACLLGTAYRHNYTAFISSSHRLNRVFDLKVTKDIKMTNVATIGENKAMAYNRKLEILNHDKNWTLNGYFQSWRYFNHCRLEIIKSFNFLPNIQRKATGVLKTIGAKGRVLVGVHIRRGDMAISRELKRGYNVATPQYISKALSYFRNTTKSPLFVVISDDSRWSRAHAKGKDVLYAGTGNAEVDMALLSLCNHAIITSGTFGWWAAYLAGGKTVYFSNFPSRGSWLASQYNIDDYYLPEWIGME